MFCFGGEVIWRDWVMSGIGVHDEKFTKNQYKLKKESKEKKVPGYPKLYEVARSKDRQNGLNCFSKRNVLLPLKILGLWQF